MPKWLFVWTNKKSFNSFLKILTTTAWYVWGKFKNGISHYGNILKFYDRKMIISKSSNDVLFFSRWQTGLLEAKGLRCIFMSDFKSAIFSVLLAVWNGATTLRISNSVTINKMQHSIRALDKKVWQISPVCWVIMLNVVNLRVMLNVMAPNWQNAA
jgi:hypothetical protein